ncbi:MAG: apolipoprotein N-acyltransferase [Acidimicrobiales bacterium]|nr:apolipoprotein N-acyltransferase [Acidimicrobiales bacterium]
MEERLIKSLKPIAGGMCLAFSMPPWGWWPMAFLSFFFLDQLLSQVLAQRERFWTGFTFGVGWLFPSTFWMVALTVPGYIIQGLLFSTFVGIAALLVPRGTWRWFALPAAFVILEAVRYRWPFGGVPLATLAMSQSRAPLGHTVRILGPLFLSALVVAAGIFLSLAWEKRWKFAAAAGVGILAMWAISFAVPNGKSIGETSVAIVQGGGEQGTRAINTDEREVFEKHLNASTNVITPLDLVLWPEDVVNVQQPLSDSPEYSELQVLARQLDSWLIAGIFERVSTTENANASIAFSPEGVEIDRYDKVRLVPFGEFVPLRGFIKHFAPSYLPVRDTKPGNGEPNLMVEIDGETVNLGISISWEIFFEDRARNAISGGGEILLNPTNGSSYWLTILQSQQVASSRLRAMETGRWVLQAAPTGFSAIVNPDGDVVARSSISETRVLHATVERRRGNTLATKAGPLPMILISGTTLVGANILARRRN